MLEDQLNYEKKMGVDAARHASIDEAIFNFIKGLSYAVAELVSEFGEDKEILLTCYRDTLEEYVDKRLIERGTW